MIRKCIVVALLLLLANVCPAQQKTYTAVKNGIIVYPASGAAKAVQVKIWAPNIVQIVASPTTTIAEDTSLMLDAKNLAPQVFKVKEETDSISVIAGKMKILVSKATGLASFYSVGGKRVGAEKGRAFEPVQLEKSSAYAITQQFDSPGDEALYGLGQHAQGIMNYKGSNLTLYQNNSEVFIPFLVSNKNYGILWDNYSITRFGDGRQFQDINTVKLFDKTGKAGNLSATYFTGKKEPAKAVTQRNETTIHYPDLEMIKNLPSNFKMDKGKVVWQGALQANATGEHTLRIWAGGYLKLWINGKMVLNRWRQCWNPFTAFVPVQLSTGKRTTFKMEWIPDGGESFIECTIAPPATAEQKGMYQLASEAGNNISYFLVSGKTYDDIIGGYRTLTGKAPVVPRWAMGFWQSRERYKTQNELLNTVKTFRDKRIPLDNIVLDWQYWKPNQWGSQQFDPTRFPSPDSMVLQLHQQYHTHFMISVWPKFYKDIPNYDLMNSMGYLLTRNAEDNTKDWLGYVSTFYDVWNPAARKQFWDLLRNNQYKLDVDAWWMDASEPDIQSNISIARRKQLMYPNAIGSATKYFNSYPLLNAQGIYEGYRTMKDKKRLFQLTRSGYAGIQRYGAAVWSGDIAANWAEMKNQIAAGINFSMSGIPYWTLDAGGFAVESRFAEGKDKKDKEEWKELQARWYQMAGFLPLFRAHGQFPFREPFNIAGEKDAAFKAIKASIDLRYKLLPHFYSLVGDVFLNNGTILRGLMMDFPADKKAETINDQFMCGSSLLVCPVTAYKANNRKVYLPAGVQWFDFHSRKTFPGGQTITAPAPLNTIPVFVKEGSIVVTGPALQYTDELPADTLTVTVYGKKDASFVLYEDEGNNTDYETGKFATIKISYDAATNIVTFAQRQGTFTEMLTNRVFKIELVDKAVTGSPRKVASKKVKATPTPRPTALLMITYSGAKIEVKLP